MTFFLKDSNALGSLANASPRRAHRSTARVQSGWVHQIDDLVAVEHGHSEHVLTFRERDRFLLGGLPLFLYDQPPW